MDAGFNFCLVTNECTTPKRLLAKKLNSFGYSSITADQIVSPAPVASRYLIENKLKPHFHIWDGVLEDFEPAIEAANELEGPPNCLVVGDAMGKINRDFMDHSLEVMLNCSEPKIVGLGSGRYYKDAGHLRMDTGAYVAAFEYCLGVKAVSIGKPTEEFFQDALKIVGGRPQNTVMIGDDIVSDVGGAQKLGMRGFLVRTGKYKASDETQRGFIADHVFDNLEKTIDTFIEHKAKREGI